MIVALVLIAVALVPKPSLAYPLGAYADSAYGYDLVDDYYGPWNPEYLRGGQRWWGLPSRAWELNADPLDLYYGSPYTAVDGGRERFVRDYTISETDYGVRDSGTAYYPPLRSRYSAPWPVYGPQARGLYYNAPLYDSPYNRRMFAAGIGTPRSSALRNGGDLTYLRR
ncbi:spider silk-constituting element SpiCE-CMa1 [Caerostris darwini]|uniref:Spider silk-constituting element SpiCE-CMa1 n=1 Tax=Caerostris darwini TaxID=1538125 RepID=A0AAV4XAT5_9ARAC|nr:spider silk-constituting element SpiCE-CMa1 [Caerostris darwini]